MSLVAAVAVAGFTSANAQDLAEAIKNVDVSGSIVYRYDDYNNEDDTANNQNDNHYKLVVNLKSKVNDDVSANVSVAAANNFGAMDTRTGGDANVDMELTKVNFAYTGIKNTTVIVGKQGIPTPWTVASDADGAEHTGTGILALSTWGPVTFAGAYFNQTNLQTNNAKTQQADTLDLDGDGNTTEDTSLTAAFTGAEDIATIGIMGNIGPVALDAWYLEMMDDEGGVDVSFDSFTIGAKVSHDFGGFKLGFNARYTNLDLDEEATGIAVNGNDNGEDNELWHATLSAKMGIFGASIGYGATDDDGGLAALDNDAKSGFQGWNTNLNGERDAELVKFNVNAQVLPELNIALNWNDLDSDLDEARDDEEIYTQITYKMSKNFTTYVRFGQWEQGDDQDSTAGRLQVQYTF